MGAWLWAWSDFPSFLSLADHMPDKLSVSSSFLPLSPPIKTETHPFSVCFSVKINSIWLATEADNMAN